MASSSPVTSAKLASAASSWPAIRARGYGAVFPIISFGEPRLAAFLTKSRTQTTINSVEDLRAFDHPLNKLPKVDTADSENRFFVRYHDLDINQHVNNVSYIEWLLESTPGFGREGFTLKELELNYLGEAFKGDRIIAMCRKDNPSGTRFSHSIVREEDQLELVRARTCWNQT